MKVGDSIRLSIIDWERHELEAAMLHACNAVDGTAAKRYSGDGSAKRFTTLLRESYAILGPMGMPGINLEATRFPVRVRKVYAPDGRPDLADVIYSIHRCTQGHGDELPDGFDLIEDAAGPPRLTRLSFREGKARFSDRIIFGLLAIAIFAPENCGQLVPDTYYLTFAGSKLMINDWWGRAADFVELAKTEPVPQITINFGDWMDSTSPATIGKKPA